MKNKKELGQNWLKTRAILEEIAELARNGVTRDDETEVADNGSAEEKSEKTEAKLCVEIGPGLGTLTTSLLRRFEKVIAVELDADLARKLPGSFPGTSLTVVNEDILKFDFSGIHEPYVVAGNIPYYITSPIIRRVLTLTRKPERVVLLMQKEVAERIMSKKETVLSLFVKNHARAYAGLVVGREEFTPPPKVDSQVVVMEPYAKPLVSDEVFGLIERGFKAPRKKLVHNLGGLRMREELERMLEECGISKDARPGEVGLDKWAVLYEKLG